MNHRSQRHMVLFVLLFITACFFKEIPAGTSAEDYDYSHRKRNCKIKLVTAEGEPLVGLIAVAQLTNDFVFGGTIRSEAFDSLSDGYGNSFRTYFDVATAGNEMKWEQVMNCAEKCNPDFSKADFLVNWLLEKKIPFRGCCLFRNEKEDLIPEWTRNLETAAFKQAMQERIDTAVGHFKGKLFQWDLINGICHGENGSFPASGLLQTKSGDPEIFGWIMDEARKRDSVADFVISDYDLITSGDQTAADHYIATLKPLSSKFEVIGAEGHFGSTMDKSSYEQKINYLAEQLGKPVFLTDVDFEIDSGQVPDKIEELMRTCFANPNVGGITMGSWYHRYPSRSGCTGCFVDSLNNETPAGERWSKVRAEWKTEENGFTDDSGMFSFNGFQGKYVVVVSCFTDTFYLEPGEGTKNVVVTYLDNTAVDRVLTGHKTIEVIISGVAVPVKLPFRYGRPLFLATYSLSGQELSRTPLNPAGGRYPVTSASSCCRVFRIETAGRLPLYTGKVTAVH